MRKNKIRILHVAQAAGGVDRYIRMLLKYLDKENLRIYWFAHRISVRKIIEDWLILLNRSK